jgi:hypothetical protein
MAPARAIVVADGWRLRRLMESPEIAANYWRALVPETLEPSQFEWKWIAGLPVLMVGFAGRLQALGDALMAAKPLDIHLLMPTQGGPILSRWRE